MSDERPGTDADTLTASLRALEQALDVARRAAQEAQQAGTRQHGALLVSEQELASARAEASGALDAVTKLQLDLGATRASLATLEQELAAERARLAAAQAAVEQERAQAAAATERATAIQAGADAQLAAASAAHQRDRRQLEQRVETLRAEFDSTVTALHAQLEQERGHHRDRIADLTRRLGELGGGVEAVRQRLEAERDERTRTDAAAERVMAAASTLLERIRTQDAHTPTPAAPAAVPPPPAPAAPPAPAPEPAPVPVPASPVSEPRWPRAAPPLQPGGPRPADLDGLLRRFDEIREQLAQQGIGAPPAPPADDRQV